MLNNKTSIPLGMLTVVAAEDLPAWRLINFEGGLCQSGQSVLGVTTKSWKQGQQAAICFSGVVPVECGNNMFDAGLAAGATNNGLLGINSGETQPVYNLDSGNVGEYVRIKL